MLNHLSLALKRAFFNCPNLDLKDFSLGLIRQGRKRIDLIFYAASS